jgi:bifunctional non-homologous end joining protein LigD
VSPPSLAPMLLTSARELPQGEDWAFEPKWDGFRCLAHLGQGTRLVSRRGKDLLPFVPELSGLHWAVPLPVVLDGELVAVASGAPSFDALRRRVFGPRRDPQTTVVLVVFDLLVLGERSITALAYHRRRRMLEGLGLGLGGPRVQLTTAYPASDGEALFATTKDLGWEGVVAKRLGSPYRAGVRSRDWVKVKHFHTRAYVIGGWLPDPDGRLRAILLGRRVKGGLAYAGAVEFGFSRPDLQRALESLHVRGPVLAGAPRRARWARPEITVRVRYSSLTEDGRVRAATVVGIRG